jgi:hypothetical protein
MNDEYTHEGAAQSEIEPAGWPKPIGVLSLVFGILAVTCGVLAWRCGSPPTPSWAR